MSYELHIGPYRGRDPQLWRAADGIVANGMELFEASQIPFATIADYLRAPEGYDPEASWQQAHPGRRRRGGRWTRSRCSPTTCARSCLVRGRRADRWRAALESFLFRLDQGDGRALAAAASCGALADRLLAAAAHLLRGPVANRR